MNFYHFLIAEPILLDFENSSERVIFSKNSESKASSRVYSRLNRDGVATEYYEYRDAAISKLSPFRPEWIKELRIVDNNDPSKTPILTPLKYWVVSTNAKFPTNKLIVKPIPVNTPTPYNFNQSESFGISANFNLIET